MIISYLIKFPFSSPIWDQLKTKHMDLVNIYETIETVNTRENEIKSCYFENDMGF